MKLIVANFKMNLLIKDIHNYLEVIEQKLNKDQVIFCPNNLHIKYFSEKNYLVGSQDISFQEYGAITGDTSINQLKEVGITYTIIGHSERRQYFLDDKYINKKVKLALSKQIKIIFLYFSLYEFCYSLVFIQEDSWRNYKDSKALNSPTIYFEFILLIPWITDTVVYGSIVSKKWE